MEPLKLHVMDEPEGTEGGLRPTEGPAGSYAKPNPEVVPRATSRTLTVAYKLKVMETVAALHEQGQGAVGAYLRKEGLYYSSVHTWEKLRDQRLLTGAREGPQGKESRCASD